MYKLDLHTHSVASPDGGITEEEYTTIITKKVLDYIAITDHNRIDFAQRLRQKLGDAIIVGEEIMTDCGEIIGLFLHEKVSPNQSLASTVSQIHQQGGLVYVPHPYDTLRHGIGEKAMLKILENIDCIEGFNGRMLLPTFNKKAQSFARMNDVPFAVGSDAHMYSGIGRAYALVEQPMTKVTFKKQLQSVQLVQQYQPWLAYIGPKWNRLKKKFI